LRTVSLQTAKIVAQNSVSLKLDCHSIFAGSVFLHARERAITFFHSMPTKATQIDCILFSRTAKIFEIYQPKHLKLIVFCSVAQRKFWNLPTQISSIWFSRAAKTFGICQQKQLTGN
jgi:hypothetical protein